MLCNKADGSIFKRYFFLYRVCWRGLYVRAFILLKKRRCFIISTKKELEINGVGYRAQAQGNKITLNVGYSHPVVLTAPEGVSVKATSATDVEVEGVSKQDVGQFAAEIRAVRPPEPYKGKGIRYVDEYVRRKEGKTGK